jgi:polysaccharide export outer membrane protein
MEVLDDQRQLGPGDRISYRVVEERRLPIASTIGDDGTLELPLIGRVSAAGRTPRNLAYAVKRPLERDYLHRATVIVGLDVASKRSPGRVYLNGRVQTQGAVEIPADETLTLRRAIMKAGGVAEFGNSRK